MIFFKPSFEAAILTRVSEFRDSPTNVRNSNVFTTQTTSFLRQQTVSFIPPFLRNFYHQLSVNDNLWDNEPSMQVFKGSFDGKLIDMLIFINVIVFSCLD